jgi:hypothetical protein
MPGKNLHARALFIGASILLAQKSIKPKQKFKSRENLSGTFSYKHVNNKLQRLC